MAVAVAVGRHLASAGRAATVRSAAAGREAYGSVSALAVLAIGAVIRLATAS